MARAAIDGSAPDHAGERRVTEADPAAPMVASIVLRGGDPSAAADLLAGNYDAASRAPAGPDPASIQSVESFAHDHGLTVTAPGADGHTVSVRGTAAQMSRAFGATLHWFESPGGDRHLSYEGSLTIPVEIAPHVIAVLGLDQRPVAAPRTGSNFDAAKD